MCGLYPALRKRSLMDNIGNIFAAYRKNLKYSQQDICDKLTGMGIPTKPAAYSTWETGNSIPNAVQFLAMCKILGITDIFNQFIGGHNPDDPMAELNEEGRAMALNYIDLLKGSEKYQAAPVRILQPARVLNLYDMPVSAGTGQFLDNDSYEEVEVGPEVPETADFGVRISGDSMMPRYLDKQIVWIQKTDELNDGEIGIFFYNGNAYCKKLLCNKKGTYLISLNDKYEPIEIAEGSTFKTFGRVVS